MRCQLQWSGTPSVGNFKLKFSKEHQGASASDRNAFLGSDGNIYNMQVRARIDSISPSSGANVGGTKAWVKNDLIIYSLNHAL